jgi:hypothetical protein
LTLHRYAVKDTTEGLWHVLASDPAHVGLDRLSALGWEEDEIILPVEFFITGRVKEGADYYESVVRSACQYLVPGANDKLLLALWNTYQQVRYLEAEQGEVGMGGGGD